MVATRLDLFGASLGAAVAAAWTAQHPARVARLVLYGGWVRGADIAAAQVREHVLGLITEHWGLGSDVLADIFTPDADAATMPAFVRYQRGPRRQSARAMLALAYDVDITDLLANVQVPTLVFHRDHDRAAPLEQGRALGAGIPGARLEVLTGRDHLPYIGDGHAVAQAIRSFLGLSPLRSVPGASVTTRQYEVAQLVAQGLTNRTSPVASGSASGLRSRRGALPQLRCAATRADQGVRVRDQTTGPRRESLAAEPEREGLAELVEPPDHRVVGDALLARLDDDGLALELQDPELDQDGPSGVDVGVASQAQNRRPRRCPPGCTASPGTAGQLTSVRPDLQVARVTAEGRERARPVHHRELRKGGEQTRHLVHRWRRSRRSSVPVQVARLRARELVQLVHGQDHGALGVRP